MKKHLFFGLGAAAAVMLSVFAGCSEQTQSGPVSSVPQVMSSEVSSAGSSQAAAADFETYFKNNPIDTAYQEAFDQAVSNTEMVRIANEFADSWKKEIESGYQKLLTVAPNEDQGEIEKQQAKWQTESQGRLDEIVQKAQETGGTMGHVQSAVDVMNFYRDRAREVYASLYEYDQNFSFVYKAE